ncbi:Thiosulfate/3-mercaptopyruvate sulfurtransferase 1 [Carex littledalei]|uniref:Thiosulfate/3-mercaptopyruvate sulfurtransferase 1 n=1 Tax=Carex littledalei TaxID=544730 RepID=A0A833QWV0_9POAL|nr:Thiosulfate/3-mercaptopyruvate sulfurtransferase 1 [Carex littledalei]
MEQDEAAVSVNWLHQNLKNPEIKEEHIPGALYFDIGRISDLNSNLPHMLPSEKAFASAVTALGITNTDKIIVYDGKGMYSAPRVWWTFRIFGHDNICVLDGGFPKWKSMYIFMHSLVLEIILGGSLGQSRADKGETLKASYIHLYNPKRGDAVATELTHRFNSGDNNFALGSSHAIDPLTTLKTRDLLRIA